jgi:hypothetical protein
VKARRRARSVQVGFERSTPCRGWYYKSHFYSQPPWGSDVGFRCLLPVNALFFVSPFSEWLPQLSRAGP